MTVPRAIVCITTLLAACVTVSGVTADPVDSVLSDDADLTDLFENISSIDPELATIADIDALPGFTPDRAALVIAYRDSVGHTRFAANDIPGLTGIEQAVLAEAVRIPVRRLTKVPVTGMFRSGYRYHPADEEPGEARYYLRGQFDLGDTAALTLLSDRDHGEPRAFDAWSVSLEFKLMNDRVRVVLGDFRPSFGQRLVYARYARTIVSGGSAYAAQPGLVANTSYEETRFMRGAFFRAVTGALTTDAWVSRRALDATLDENGHAVTIRETGIYPAGSPRGNLAERLAGVSVMLSHMDRWQFGVLGSVVRYDPALARDEGEQNLHDPSGDEFAYVSVTGSYRINHTLMYAEHAREGQHEHASAAGIEFDADGFRGVVAARNATAGYWALRSAGITSFGSPDNEEGLYAGFDSRFAGSGSLSASYDIARTKTRTASAAFARARRRMTARIVIPATERLDLSLAVRATDDRDTGALRQTQKMAVEHACSPRCLVDVVIARTAGEGDVGIYGGGTLEIRRGQVQGTVGIAGYDIPSYAARYYRYEPDVPGSGMMRPVWGTGGAVLLQARIGAWSARYRLVSARDRVPGHELTVQADAVW